MTKRLFAEVTENTLKRCIGHGEAGDHVQRAALPREFCVTQLLAGPLLIGINFPSVWIGRLVRVVISIDPFGCAGGEDRCSDEPYRMDAWLEIKAKFRLSVRFY
jgi:hypothetical protein